MFTFRTLVLIGFGLVGFAGAAQAQFRNMSCEQLYAQRNGIYKDAGLCFHTARAFDMFGNAGCSYDNVNDVPLSRNDRATVAAIAREEAERGCPR